MGTGTGSRAVWMSVVICILSRITSVHLQAPPREYFVAVGQEVTLTCDRNTLGWSQHDNPNSSSITWRRGEGSGASDIDLTNSRDSRITVTGDVDQYRTSIRIANVQHRDAGIYRCLVEREVGTKSLMMEVITMEVSANPSSVVNEGATVTLTCNISNSTYGTGLLWYHGDTYISRGNQLTLTKVKRSQQGEWKCFLYNQHYGHFASYKLEFTSTGSDVGKAPAVKKYFIHEGGEVSLSCDESDPGFQWKDHSQLARAVTWKWRSHDGTTKRYDQNIRNPSQPSDYIDTFPLALSKVTFSHGGVYTCEFTGYYRTGNLTMELVTMKVSANPSRSVSEGDTVTLTCLISNSGDGTGLVWYHSGTYIDKGDSLTLNKVKRSQQGEWKCFLYNQHYSPFALFKLEFRSTGSDVGKAPAVKKYFIHEGGEVSLSCDESDPGFQWKDHSQLARTVTWKWRSHDGTTKRYDQNIRNPSQPSDYRDKFPLALSKVTFSRGGVYTCEFTGYYRTGNLTMELVTMKVSANPSRSVSEGDTVTLTCLISNSGDGTGLVWYHSGTYIDKGDSLTLNKVKRSQQGEWKCFLYNQHYSPFASFKLEFRSTGSDVGKAPAVKKYFIHEGGEVSLSCDESDPGFQWKDHSQLARTVTWKWRSHDGTTKGYDQNIRNPSQPSDYIDKFPLALSKVTFSRGGVYTCEFTGYYRTGNLTMELVTMKVSANPPRSVSEGATVTLTCDISNRTYVQSIVWTHGGIEINPGNSVLILHKVKRCQEGAWICRVKTQTDQASVSHDLKVSSQNVCDVKAPAPRKHFVSVGQKVILPCVESDPEFKWKDHPSSDLALTWRWERQGSGSETIVQYHKQTGQRNRDLSKNTAISLVSRVTALKSTFDEDNFSIQISKVQYSDAGLYICHFAGYFRTSSLTRELITMEVSANPSSVVSEGATVTLRCDISNSGDGTGLLWYHGDTYIDKGNQLTLTKVKRSQQGEWKCFLYNQHYSPFASYKLEFRSTGAEQNATRNYTAQIGEGTTLPCTESDPGFVWRSSSNESRSVTWYWRPRGDSTVRPILTAHPAGPHAAFSSHLNSHVNISSSAFDDDDFSLAISVVDESSAGVYTCQLTGYYRSGSLMSELLTTQVPGASPHVLVAVGVVLAVLLFAGTAVVAVVRYRRRKLNAGPQHSQRNSVNLQEMAAGERTTDENKQAHEEEALVYSQIEALPESSGWRSHNHNVEVIYASVNAEEHDNNEVVYSVVQASAADKMKPKVKPKGNGGCPNAVVNRPEHDNNEVVYSVVQVPAAGNMKPKPKLKRDSDDPNAVVNRSEHDNNEVVYSVVQVPAAGNMKPKPKLKRDSDDPNAVVNRSEHDNNEVIYSVVQAPAAGNIKPKLKPKPKRDGGDPNAVVDRSEHDKNEAVYSMVQAPAAGNMNPNTVVNRPKPEKNQVVYSLLSTPSASKPALKPKPNKAVDALYTVVAKKNRNVFKNP